MGRYDDSSEEEGEIIEETTPLEASKPSVEEPPAPAAPVVISEPIEPTVDRPEEELSRKEASAEPPKPFPQNNQQTNAKKRPNSASNTRSSDDKRRKSDGKSSSNAPKDKKTYDSFSSAEKQKELSTVLRVPYQSRTSRVFLNFNLWLDDARKSQYFSRLAIDDVQSIITNTLKNESPSQFLESYDGTRKPQKVCVVVANGLHPDMLGRGITNKDMPLPFFESCTTIPCGLASAMSLKTSQKPKEVPISQSLFRFPVPNMYLDIIDQKELYSQYEITVLASYSSDARGWTDELILQPSGTFFRKTTLQTGEWKIDGDLLHLRWTIAQPDNQDDETKNITAIDVLASEDDNLRVFRTNSNLDATYGLQSIDPEKAAVKRTLKVTLLRAAKVNPLLAPPELPKLWTAHYSIEDFLLTRDEMIAHNYPMDVTVEQYMLMKATKDCSMDEFKSTQPPPDDDQDTKIYALDCEMCETDLGSELTRITVIDESGSTVYDTLVKPRSTILNYHTEFSGITEEALANVKVHLEDVQAHLLTLFNQRTILVGHSLDSDLKALRLVHLRVADTAILYPHHRGFPFKPSLKTLARTFLQETIQDQAEGHDSAQDAITALKLFQLKVKEGVCFGLPAPPVFSRAYTTLLEQLPDATKHFCTVGAPPLQKPWVLHASGALNDLLNNTITNVNADEVSKHDALPPAHHELYTKDLMWLEMDINGTTDPKLYMETLHLWQRQQVASIQALDTMLANLFENVPPDTLVLVLPQADLGIYRYMKAVRMKSRWDAWDSQWTDSDQFNLQYAYSGLLDSCLFLKQK